MEGVDVYGACSLSQVVHFLRGRYRLGTGPAQSTVGPTPDPLNRILISARSKASSMSNAPSNSGGRCWGLDFSEGRHVRSQPPEPARNLNGSRDLRGGQQRRHRASYHAGLGGAS
jgi:hypothetical protein